MRVFVVLNPVAGQSDPDRVRRVLSEQFAGEQWRLEVHETKAEEPLADIVREALQQQAFEAVFAAGGDGTVSQVVDALAGGKVPLGIIPTGTTNALAQALKLPQEVEGACRLLAERPALVRLDALQVDERYFVLNVGMGLGAATMEKTARDEKRRFGVLAYVWTALKELAGMQPHRFTIEADGATRVTRAADVLLANAGVLSGPLRWGDHIRPDDGRIDICIVRVRTAWDYAVLIWHVLRRQQRQNSHIQYDVAQETITVRTDVPVPASGDGDLIGHTPIVARVARGVVPVFVGRGETG